METARGHRPQHWRLKHNGNPIKTTGAVVSADDLALNGGRGSRSAETSSADIDRIDAEARFKNGGSVGALGFYVQSVTAGVGAFSTDGFFNVGQAESQEILGGATFASGGGVQSQSYSFGLGVFGNRFDADGSGSRPLISLFISLSIFIVAEEVVTQQRPKSEVDGKVITICA